ncbi:MAG: DUF4292 domain-containing protein [Bacteroidetes bacterium]|nr:DUF4292 domain-containing protein [Bacteroidota bacterium]
MNQHTFKIILCAFILTGLFACKATKKLQTAIIKKDTTQIATVPVSVDSISPAIALLDSFKKHKIAFQNFSAKVKVQYEDRNGKQPDVNAFIRMKKDSIIWVSISATFLNIEAFRILITADSIMILNKLDKTYESHPLEYLETVSQIPLTFSTLQDLLIGNPIYVGDSILSFKKTENYFFVSTIDSLFKNLLTIEAGNFQLEKSKLDDRGVNQNRTADLYYSNYENTNNFAFPTFRQIMVAEKSSVNIFLNFKQYEFNKELSYPFSIPRNYKKK